MKKDFLKILFVSSLFISLNSYAVENEPSTLEDLFKQDEALINSKVNSGELDKQVVVIDKSIHSHYSVNGQSFFDDPIYKTHDIVVDGLNFIKTSGIKIQEGFNNTKNTYITDKGIDFDIVKTNIGNFFVNTKNYAEGLFAFREGEGFSENINHSKSTDNQVKVDAVPVIPVFEK